MKLSTSRLHPRKTSPATKKAGQHRADQWYSARMTIGWNRPIQAKHNTAVRIHSRFILIALPRLFHGQADALFLLVHLQNDHLHNIPHGHRLGGVPDEFVTHLRDVHQTVLMDADIHEHAEVDDVPRTVP